MSSSRVAAHDVEQLVLDLGLCGDGHWRTRLHSVTLALASATAALRLALPASAAKGGEIAAIEAILQRDESVRIGAVARLIAALLQCPAFATKRHLFGFVGAPADEHVVRFQAIHADIQRDRLDVADALAAFLRVRDERDAAHHVLLDTMASARSIDDGLRAIDNSIAVSRRAISDACARVGIADRGAVAAELEQLAPQLTAACDTLASMLKAPLIDAALLQIGDRAAGESLSIVSRVGATPALLLTGKQREQLLCALVELRSFHSGRLVAVRSATDDSAAVDVDETSRMVAQLDAVRKALAEPRFAMLLRLATPELRQQLAREIEAPQSAVDILTRKGDEMRATLRAVQARTAEQTATLRAIDDRLELVRVELGELLSEASLKPVDISL